MANENVATAASGLGRPRFDTCSVLVFDPHADTRHHAADALSGMGFREVEEVREFDAMERAFAGGNHDLLIGDTGGQQGSVCKIVKDLRHHAFGFDPFVGVILTTWSASRDNVRRVVNSGADLLIVKPFTAQQIAARVRAIVDQRKPFVVTLDYIGPDRRSDASRASAIELIRVPNALRQKARNDPSAAASPKTIEFAMARINRHKIARFDLQIGVLVNSIERSIETGQPGKKRLAIFKKLLRVIHELGERIVSTDFAEAGAPCAKLVRHIQAVAAAGDDATSEQLAKLKQASMAVHHAFSPGKPPFRIKADIHAAVSAMERRNGTAIP